MNYKHTPGTWRVDQDDRPGMEWNRHIMAGDSAICFMAHSDGRDNERDEANANLIAAAPDLLNALESIVEMNPELPMGGIEAAQAAIAKATGEQA